MLYSALSVHEEQEKANPKKKPSRNFMGLLPVNSSHRTVKVCDKFVLGDK